MGFLLERVEMSGTSRLRHLRSTLALALRLLLRLLVLRILFPLLERQRQRELGETF